MDESHRESQERYQKGGSNRAKARQIDDWMSAILPTLELSSLRSQLECWNTGKMACPPRPETGTGSGGATGYAHATVFTAYECLTFHCRILTCQVWAREYCVLGNSDFGLLENFILTWEGIC